MNSGATSAPSLQRDAADLANDEHFLRAVSGLAASQVVVADSAIYSSSGVKLLEKGARVDSRLYAQLIQHRLAGALDDQLTTSNPVDVTCLEAQVLLLSGANPLGRLLVRSLGQRQHLLLEALRHMKWAQHASFKMTVMRHHLPQLFEHSILMMMVSVSLAIKQGMAARDCADLAVAALLHDVGMLYMPVSWQNPRHKLTHDEQRQLAAHTITGMLVVRAAKAYSREVEDAVLEHHERLDGSGYPRLLKAEEISPWGRILMLAEVVSAFYGKYQDMPAQRLSLMLRMNHSRFDTALMQHVFAMLAQDAALQTQQSMPSGEAVREVVGALGGLFQHWQQCKRQLPEGWQSMPGARACMYVELRLQSLQKSLAESGSHPRQQVDWQQLFEEDPSSTHELMLIYSEALWQVEHCVEACLRRWPNLLHAIAPVDRALAEWLKASRKVFAQKHMAAQSVATLGN